MKLGTGECLITPEVGTAMQGFGGREQPSVGVHDDLYARAFFLRADDDALLWLNCDLIGLTIEYVRGIRAALCADLGIQPRQVVITCTHTHGGPPTSTLRDAPLDEAYLDRLTEQLRAVAGEAHKSLEPVRCMHAQAELAINRDRRPPSAHSHVDRVLNVIAFQRADGDYAGVLANYPVHAVAAGRGNRHFTGDIQGLAAREISRRVPGRPVTLVTNGACGNLNPPPKPKTGEPANAVWLGRQYADTVLGALSHAQVLAHESLATQMRTIHLPLELPTEDQVERRYQELTARRARAYEKAWRDQCLALLRSGTAPTHVPLDLQVIRIGDFRFAAVGAEVFSRMAEELRATHGPRVGVLGYANGNFGYLPPAAIYDEGGYEVDAAYIFYGCFNVERGGHERVRDELNAMLSANGLSVDDRPQAIGDGERPSCHDTGTIPAQRAP